MSGNKLKSQSNNNNKPIDSSVLTELIEVQKEKISFDKSNLELKKQYLKNQTELAKQSLNIQEKLIGEAPKEKRKNRSQIFIFIAISTLIFLSFSAFCLIYKYEKFLNYLIETLSYLLTLSLGYYAGTYRNKMKKDETEIQDADRIN